MVSFDINVSSSINKAKVHQFVDAVKPDRVVLCDAHSILIGRTEERVWSRMVTNRAREIFSHPGFSPGEPGGVKIIVNNMKSRWLHNYLFSIYEKL